MTTLLGIFGGIGMFLLGVTLLTDGLKAFAGDSLRRALMTFTGTPLKALATGALTTLLVQSSSATTVTVIGFVSAGLLTFPQALGVVLGASLGTTGTGWLVSLIGLKLNLTSYALPLVGLGAFMKLLAPGRWSALGMGLAGFALIFVGIDGLQRGMGGLAATLDLAALPSRGLWGHLVAVAIGALMTVIMQSSSAAMATTLTALHAGAVNFDQAASLVIGAAIGTTVTGALAAIGASVPAKRTALAHVLFNLGSGLIALILLPLFMWIMRWAQQHLGWTGDATSLAAFHTTFIGLGVAVFLPFVRGFAATIERILPDSGPQLTRHLDRTLRETPAVALEATRRALQETARVVIDALNLGLEARRWDVDRNVIFQALQEIQAFLEGLNASTEHASMTQSKVAQLHAIDHLLRLHSRINPTPAIQEALRHDRLQDAAGTCQRILEQAAAVLRSATEDDWPTQMASMAGELARSRRDLRPLIIDQTAVGERGPTQALDLLDALRWFDRVGHHVWRTCYYLADGSTREPISKD